MHFTLIYSYNGALRMASDLTKKVRQSVPRLTRTHPPAARQKETAHQAMRGLFQLSVRFDQGTYATLEELDGGLKKNSWPVASRTEFQRLEVSSTLRRSMVASGIGTRE